MVTDILARHRGPYRLTVTRVDAKGRFHTEHLAGTVESDDVLTDSLALLTDPRDSIVDVGVWSLRENQFVTLITGRERDV